MGKRSEKPRIDKDRYFTHDQRAIVPQFIERVRGKSYAEPCYGEGDLEDLLMDVATCKWRSDIVPFGNIKQDNALNITKRQLEGCDLIITNPPWSRPILHDMISHFSKMKPTWLLFDADWMHTKQSARYMKYCREIISVGRLNWIPGTKTVGKDNVAWYFFDRKWFGPTQFYGREGLVGETESD